MTEEELRLVVSMQLRQVNEQLRSMKKNVNKAMNDIASSRDIDHVGDNINRSFKSVNKTSSQEIRELYKNIRRYLRDIDQDTTKTAREMRYELENAFNNLFNGLNGGNINLGNLSRALQKAIGNAGLGDAVGGEVSRALSSGSLSLANMLPLFTLLGISDLNKGLAITTKNITGTNQEIASMATSSKDIVKTFGPLMSETEALNVNMLNLEKILALLLKQFGQMAEMLQRIANIQMGTGLANYGKYVSSAITQMERLQVLWQGNKDKEINLFPELENVPKIKNSISEVKKAFEEFQRTGDYSGVPKSIASLKEGLQETIKWMIVAQNTLNNIKHMSDQGIFEGIDTGSLQKVSEDLAQMMENIRNEFATAGVDFSFDADLMDVINQFDQFEGTIDNVSAKFNDIQNMIKNGETWTPDIDYSNIENIFDMINSDYINDVLNAIHGEPIKPEVDTSGIDKLKEAADEGKLTLKDLFNVFNGKEMFHNIDLEFDEETFNRLTQEAQEVKTVLDELNAKYNVDVDFTSLDGVKAEFDKVKKALQECNEARKHLNQLDQAGFGGSDEALRWTQELIAAQDRLKAAIIGANQQFGQYRLVDWTMFTRDAHQAVLNVADEVRHRLTTAMESFSGKAGTILYRLGAYFTIPPERMDQILAVLRDKFSSFWDSVKSKGREALNGIAQSELVQKFKPQFDKVVALAKTTADKVKTIFDKIWSSRFGAFINNNLSIATRIIKTSVGKIKTHLEDLKKKSKSALDKVKEHFKKAADSTKESTDKLGTSIKGLVAKFISLYAIIAGLKKLWELGKDAMMLEGQLQNLYITLGGFIDETGKKVLRGDQFQQWAKDTARAFGISEAAAIRYGNTYSMLMSQTLPQKLSMEKTITILKQAALVSSKTGRTVDDVLERIRSGVLGIVLCCQV